MRININLATQPYEVAQQNLRRMQLLVVSMALVALLLVGYILYQRAQTRDIDAKIAQAQHEIGLLDSEKSQAQAILNKPVNRDVADQSQFLNELFARKALSWTRVFSEMERLMPPGIHVVSMKPDYTNNNQLMLHMVVATDAREHAVELVKRMEKSPHFRAPQVVAENVTSTGDQSAGPGNIQFDIAALYVPDFQLNAGDEDKGGSANRTTTAQNSGGPR